MAERPEIHDGYLGTKPEFAEYGLELDTHKKFEFKAQPNHVEIKLKAKKPVKMTQKLIECKTGKDLSEYAFCQMMNQLITFHVHLPTEGYYKFQAYALPADNETKAIPNVLNYLINCNRVTSQSFPFPRQYADWKMGCFLLEPMVLHPKSNLKNVEWHVKIPNAKKVAIVVSDEWVFLERKGGPIWQGKTNLDAYKGKNEKVTVRGNFVSEDKASDFRTLLEYKI